MADRITYVGLDVHKEDIVVAAASGGLRGEVREYGRITNTATALDRLQRKLGSDGMKLRFCYEAGPCGYVIHRRLTARGPVHHLVLEDYIQAVEAAEARRDRLTAQIAARLPELVAGAGRRGAADNARHGPGQCRHPDRRIG